MKKLIGIYSMLLTLLIVSLLCGYPKSLTPEQRLFTIMIFVGVVAFILLLWEAVSLFKFIRSIIFVNKFKDRIIELKNDKIFESISKETPYVSYIKTKILCNLIYEKLPLCTECEYTVFIGRIKISALKYIYCPVFFSNEDYRMENPIIFVKNGFVTKFSKDWSKYKLIMKYIDPYYGNFTFKPNMSYYSYVTSDIGFEAELGIDTWEECK